MSTSSIITKLNTLEISCRELHWPENVKRVDHAIQMLIVGMQISAKEMKWLNKLWADTSAWRKANAL